jgi:hypothetical protein
MGVQLVRKTNNAFATHNLVQFTALQRDGLIGQHAHKLVGLGFRFVLGRLLHKPNTEAADAVP